MKHSFDKLPDTDQDVIGQLLSKIQSIVTFTQQKRELVNEAVSLMEKAGYVSIRRPYYSYSLSCIGESCQWDVPIDRRGKLLKFRGLRVRIVCIANTGRNGRIFLAGLL